MTKQLFVRIFFGFFFHSSVRLQGFTNIVKIRDVIKHWPRKKMFQTYYLYHKTKAELKILTGIFAKQKPNYFHHEWTRLKAVMLLSKETEMKSRINQNTLSFLNHESKTPKNIIINHRLK